MYELKLLALLSERKIFERSEVALGAMTLAKDAVAVIRDISIYYKDFPAATKIDWDDFYTWCVNHRHPLWDTKKKAIRKAIIENVKIEPLDSTVFTRLLELSVADEVEDAIVEIRNGSGSTGIEDIENVLHDFNSMSVSGEVFFVDMDVQDLVSSVIKGSGIKWRLTDLNLSVGQLHASDFVVIGKRPETGGTTFVCSEFTYMLDQLPEGKSAIIFNNEEGGKKIGLRLIQSALATTTKEIESDPLRVQTAYTKYLNGRKLYIYHNPHMTNRTIEAVLASHPDCWLIGINVLDKIGGFNTPNEVARYRDIAGWCRRLADKHGAVIGIAQADGEADGQKYLRLTQLYGSKTGVQGEADMQIMIGVDPDNPSLRYFSIVKNKKPTTGDMLPEHRHAKFPANFDIERGRFLSIGGLK